MRHLLICTGASAGGRPACGPRGGDAVVAAVQRGLVARGGNARVTACACLGPCFDGPNAVVYPDGVWYGELAESDADALIDHLIDGRVLANKRVPAPGE